MISPLGRMLVTTFGLGYLRPASGTWGSLPPVALAAVLWWAGFAHTWVWWATLAAVVLIFSWGCVAFGDWAEAQFGKKDPGQVVADETAGMALTLMFIPAGAMTTPGRVAIALALAFVLFRLADILKPPPIHGLQRYPAGWGILLDDLAAGVLAGVITLVVLLFVPS